MGDPAGIGPEIIARGWTEMVGSNEFQFVVFGNPQRMRGAIETMSLDLQVRELADPGDAGRTATPPDAAPLLVIPTGPHAAAEVVPGQVSALAGRAAFDYLDAAIHATLQGDCAAIVTAPINKESIRMAGVAFPGHTEILAARCGVLNFAMMLYIPEGQQVGGEIGLGVVHTTLHQSLRSALDDLSVDSILANCHLANDFANASLSYLGLTRPARIAVAALNPHAGENGLFGDEESRIIAPAVRQAQQMGIDCCGPLSCDTLMGRAVRGEFDMVVAMYHDQGHIALKLLGMHKAVNVTLGLPIVRTSVAHGTAFEIAGKGSADPTSLLRAVAVAERLVAQRHHPDT